VIDGATLTLSGSVALLPVTTDNSSTKLNLTLSNTLIYQDIFVHLKLQHNCHHDSETDVRRDSLETSVG
jgi:hypothetical protein